MKWKLHNILSRFGKLRSSDTANAPINVLTQPVLPPVPCVCCSCAARLLLLTSSMPVLCCCPFGMLCLPVYCTGCCTGVLIGIQYWCFELVCCTGMLYRCNVLVCWYWYTILVVVLVDCCGMRILVYCTGVSRWCVARLRCYVVMEFCTGTLLCGTRIYCTGMLHRCVILACYTGVM